MTVVNVNNTKITLIKNATGAKNKNDLLKQLLTSPYVPSRV